MAQLLLFEGLTLTCTRCERELPQDAFWRMPKSKTGRHHICRQCAAERGDKGSTYDEAFKLPENMPASAVRDFAMDIAAEHLGQEQGDTDYTRWLESIQTRITHFWRGATKGQKARYWSLIMPAHEAALARVFGLELKQMEGADLAPEAKDTLF